MSHKHTLDHVYSREPSATIVHAVYARIQEAQRIRAQRKAYGYGALTLLALIGLVPMVQYASMQASDSGLYSYISLFISDGRYMLNNFNISMLSILESLPMMSTALTLAILLVAAYAFKKSSVYIRTLHMQTTQLHISNI